MWYNLDIYKFALHLIPPSLRKSKLTVILNVLLYPFGLLYQAFGAFRNNSLKRLNINGQVIYIEKALNDAYNLDKKEIFITDVDSSAEGDSIIFPDNEKTMCVYANGEANVLYISSQNEGSHEGDFIVNLPSFLEAELNNIKNIVNYNKPAGRSYVIKLYEYE